MESRNKNAHIESIRDGNFVLTKTARRDEGEIGFSVRTYENINSTQLTLVSGGSTTNVMKLTGRQARTLYTVLQRHFQALDKSW